MTSVCAKNDFCLHQIPCMNQLYASTRVCVCPLMTSDHLQVNLITARQDSSTETVFFSVCFHVGECVWAERKKERKKLNNINNVVTHLKKIIQSILQTNEEQQGGKEMQEEREGVTGVVWMGGGKVRTGVLTTQLNYPVKLVWLHITYVSSKTVELNGIEKRIEHG